MVIALLLLAVITVLSLGVIHFATLQQQMSGNFYDRQMAFQSAQAALLAGAHYIKTNATIYDCSTAGQICTTNPFTDPNMPSSNIHSVKKNRFDAGGKAASQPQYVVQYLGKYADKSGVGCAHGAGHKGYNSTSGCLSQSPYYRVTVRSGDPSKVGNRAVVTLQASYKQ